MVMRRGGAGILRRRRGGGAGRRGGAVASDAGPAHPVASQRLDATTNNECRPSRAGPTEEEAMRLGVAALLAGGVLLAANSQAQDKKYGPGVSDSEIAIGQSAPFSGPASAFGIYG